MKLHWGTGLAASFILFVVVTLILVGFAMTKDVDLVTDRYYEKGLQYEDRIESMRRANALAQPVHVVARDGEVLVVFPSADIGGRVTLYRPSGSANDFSLPIRPDSAGVQHISTARCQRGLWHVQVAWEAAGIGYYIERPVIVE